MNACNTADFASRSYEMPSWKGTVGNIAAILLAIPFLVAGIYHAIDPFGVQRLFEEILVWPQISLPLVLMVSVGDMFAGSLLLVPRYRRWGGWLAAGLLAIYIAYFGYHYRQLVGVECSCFPIHKTGHGSASHLPSLVTAQCCSLACWWRFGPLRDRCKASAPRQ